MNSSGLAVVAVGVERPELDPRQRLAAVTDHQVPDEGVDGVEADIVAVLDQRAGCGRVAHRRLDEGEVLRAVVVQDEKTVLAADDGVFDGVLDELPSWPHGDELGVGVGGVGIPDLRCHGAARGDDHVLVAAGAADREPEPLVGFVIDLLGRQARTDAVPPHGVRPPRLVDRGVVDGAVVGGPGRARADADDLVVVKLVGSQVLEPQCESLVADDVDRVGQGVGVDADRGGAEREEVVPLRLHVLVEQHLLAGDLGVLIELRGRPVVGIGYRATAVHAVLLALETPAVVPPVAAAGGHRQVGLLGAGLYLVEDLLPQRRQMIGDLLGVGVLRLPGVRSPRGRTCRAATRRGR